MQRNHKNDKQHAGYEGYVSAPLVDTLDFTSPTSDKAANIDNQTLVAHKVENGEALFIKAGTPDQQRTAVISVLLVDDHALLREGLRQLLELEEDIHIAGEAVDGFDAIQKIRHVRPDVVLMDIRMPMIDGLAVTRQITFEFPSIAVIMLTMYGEHSQMLQAIRNGARGYLLKSSSSHEVAQAIRSVHAGGMLIEPELTGAIVREFRRLSDSTSTGQYIDALSTKEIEILRFVATGMSNKEIAEKLAYSEKTVKNYLSIIFQKLGIRDRTQAAIFALRQGLLPAEDL